MKPRFILQLGITTIICLSLGLSIAGCGKGSGKADGEVKFIVGFSQCNVAEPWRKAQNEAMEKEAQQHPQIQLEVADAMQDNGKQVAQIRSFITQQVDLIIVAPNEAAPLTPVVKEAYDAGIKVIVLERAILGDTYHCFIGPNNRIIGRQAGELIARLLPDGGNVVEVKGLTGSPPARDRSEPMREVLQEHPNIKIIHEFEARWLRKDALDLMGPVLTAQDDIDIVYAHNDPMAMGAYLAAQKVGREKDMLFIGVDGLPGPEGGCQMVLDGVLYATFLYPNGGKEAIQIAEKILTGQPYESEVVLPTVMIDKNNAAEFVGS